jgi:hypothetical protein
MKSGNIFYHSVQNLLSTGLISKKLAINVHRNMVLSVALCGCKTWSLTVREDRKIRVFENGVLRGIFGPKRGEVTGNGENCIMRSLMTCTPHPISFG